MPTISIEDIINQLRRAQQDANEANIARYQAGLGELTGARDIMRGLYEQAGTLTQDIGRGAAEDIERGAQRTFAGGRQSLISAGLGNTTILGSLMRGTEEDRRRAMRQVEEQQGRLRAGLATQRAGAEMGAGAGLAGFMAARQDVGPDPALYAQLIQASLAAGDQKPVVMPPVYKGPFSATAGKYFPGAGPGGAAGAGGMGAGGAGAGAAGAGGMTMGPYGPQATGLATPWPERTGPSADELRAGFLKDAQVFQPGPIEGALGAAPGQPAKKKRKTYEEYRRTAQAPVSRHYYASVPGVAGAYPTQTEPL